MKRSDFCRTIIGPGVVCSCSLIMAPGSVVGRPEKSSSGTSENENETSCEEKMDFTSRWVKRFFEVADLQLDQETRNKLMQANGAACAKGAYGEIPGDYKEVSMEEIDQKITLWQQSLGEENIYREGNIVYFNYVANPRGLKISDGYCLCPMVENKPERLSPTFCQCSVGYVKYMFQRFFTLKPVQVDLLESLRTGGKACRFKISL